VRACISNFLHVRPQSGDSWSVRLFKWSYGLHTNTVVNRGIAGELLVSCDFTNKPQKPLIGGFTLRFGLDKEISNRL